MKNQIKKRYLNNLRFLIFKKEKNNFKEKIFNFFIINLYYNKRKLVKLLVLQLLNTLKNYKMIIITTMKILIQMNHKIYLYN